jgi:hypothetical protein
MLGLFNKKSWQHEVLEELRGSEGNLSVRLTTMPCLRHAASGDRKYAWSDFGHDLLLALHDAIGGAEHAHSRLSAGSSVAASIRLKQGPEIGVEISGKPSSSVRNFESDIADALISAFESRGIRR